MRAVHPDLPRLQGAHPPRRRTRLNQNYLPHPSRPLVIWAPLRSLSR